MDDKIILISISKEELKELIHDAVAHAINTKKEKELLSFRETLEFLGISASCLNKWKSQGKIPYKRLGKRIFFNTKDVLAALKEEPHYSKMKALRQM